MSEANPEDARKAAGRLIRVQRGELGLTQQEVAERAGVNIDTVSDMERGMVRPRTGTVAAVARVLGLDTAELHKLQAIADQHAEAS